MNLLKSLIMFVLCAGPLLLTQCGSTTKKTTQETVTQETRPVMEMRNPTFSKAKTTYNTWIAGIQGGGSGIKMQFAWSDMPENLVMKEAYFRGMHSEIRQGQKGYTANFKTKLNSSEDMVMHSDPVQEAVNTPPPTKKLFPVELTDQQVGIIYEENGSLVYTIINNLKELPQVAYPSAPPREEGY